MDLRASERPHAVRRRVWEILEIARPGDRVSALFDIGIRALIALNVLAVILETVPTWSAPVQRLFVWFEVLSVAVFSIEYAGRIWACVEVPAYRAPLRGRLRFAATPLALIDLLAVLPSLLPFFGVDLRILRGVRLFRLFRILKLTRYSRSLRTLGRVLGRRREELVITLSGVGLIVLVASSLMYYAEHAAQPDKFSSIPAAMWWGVVTLTTLGYGDVYPITTLGRLMGGLFAVSGILLIALPTAILGAAFMEELEATRGSRSPDTALDAPPDAWLETPPSAGPDAQPSEDSPVADRCPHCGQSLRAGHP